MAVAPPGFSNRGEVRYGSIGGLEYEVPQKLTHLLQCIGNFSGLVRYDFNRLAVYLFFRTPIGEASPLPPLPAPLICGHDAFAILWIKLGLMCVVNGAKIDRVVQSKFNQSHAHTVV